MCQKCIDAIQEYWPNLPEKHYGDLLLCCTAWPFCDANHTKIQIADMAKRSNCDLGKAMELADKDNQLAMEKK